MINFNQLELKKFFLKERLIVLDCLKQCLTEYEETDDKDRKESLVRQAKLWGRFSLHAKDQLTKL